MCQSIESLAVERRVKCMENNQRGITGKVPLIQWRTRRGRNGFYSCDPPANLCSQMQEIIFREPAAAAEVVALLLMLMI